VRRIRLGATVGLEAGDRSPWVEGLWTAQGSRRRRSTLGPVARFLTLDDVADELAISRSQAYALVRNGSLPAMKVGGRGQWRVERTRLEQWIEQAHADTDRFIAEHPFTGEPDDEPD
jgi:excisionase family DNA binding protein